MPSEREIAVLASKLLGPWLDALKNRDRKNASRKAGQLTFWRDGMLGDLKKIASGIQDEETTASLKKKFDDSATGITETINELRVLRGKLAPSKFAQQIDLILNHDQFGKGSIRESIQIVIWDLQPGGNRHGTAEFAAGICRQIEILNAELEKLARMVTDPA